MSKIGITESDIAKRYQSLDEIDHVKKKSGMWIGNTNIIKEEHYIYEDGKMASKELEYIPGLLKIIDEIISNSVDEYRRNTNLGMTELIVSMVGSKGIKIYDNGGIHIIKHPETNTWLPEFLFGKLRSSSNYDDTEERNGVGTNGVGSALTNILSTKFKVVSCDKKNKCTSLWTGNMRNHEEPIIEKCSEHYTETYFEPDLELFKIDRIPFDFSHILRKRCLDAAAGTIGLKVTFNLSTEDEQIITSDTFEFESFEDYIKLYDGLIDKEEIIYGVSPGISKNNPQAPYWEYAIVPGSNLRVGFVNGALCNKGSHIRLLEWWTENIASDILSTKHKIEVSKKTINNNYSIFVKLNVLNPAYDSQTKENLITNDNKYDKTNTYPRITEEFEKRVQNSDLILDLVDWYKEKEAAEKAKSVRKMNKNLSANTNIDKLLDANSKNREECELWIFEGDSASSGFRTNRIPATQGSYKLRGNVKNTVSKSEKAIFDNKEFSDLISAIGLRFGGNDVSKLRYSKIIICTDMDHDGDKIAGLLIAFFNDHFPELITAGMIYRALSPIIIASKGSISKAFFSIEEYKKEERDLSDANYRMKYIKGLAGLNKDEYKSMIQTNKHLIKFIKDEDTDKIISAWFTGNSKLRKEIIQETYSN